MKSDKPNQANTGHMENSAKDNLPLKNKRSNLYDNPNGSESGGGGSMKKSGGSSIGETGFTKESM